MFFSEVIKNAKRKRTSSSSSDEPYEVEHKKSSKSSSLQSSHAKQLSGKRNNFNFLASLRLLRKMILPRLPRYRTWKLTDGSLRCFASSQLMFRFQLKIANVIFSIRCY